MTYLFSVRLSGAMWQANQNIAATKPARARIARRQRASDDGCGGRMQWAWARIAADRRRLFTITASGGRGGSMTFSQRGPRLTHPNTCERNASAATERGEPPSDSGEVTASLMPPIQYFFILVSMWYLFIYTNVIKRTGLIVCIE